MASEYWEKKFKDVKPEEKRELTPKERRANWWHYHKWIVPFGILLLVIAVCIGSSVMDLGQAEPDYHIAYVGKTALPNETVDALEEAIAALGTDCNGDGKIVVRINEYVEGAGTAGGYYADTTQASLMADLVACESYFFLLEYPEDFQQDYEVLCRLDGTLPEEGDQGDGEYYLSWSDCPVLSGLELGEYSDASGAEAVSKDSQELLSRMSFARRGFQDGETTENAAACDALWAVLTDGALS